MVLSLEDFWLKLCMSLIISHARHWAVSSHHPWHTALLLFSQEHKPWFSLKLCMNFIISHARHWAVSSHHPWHTAVLLFSQEHKPWFSPCLRHRSKYCPHDFVVKQPHSIFIPFSDRPSYTSTQNNIAVAKGKQSCEERICELCVLQIRLYLSTLVAISCWHV